MAVDWGRDDALLTERNSAVAEAKLWLRRLQAAQAEREQALKELREADKFLTSWQEAYYALLKELHRLEVERTHEVWRAESAESLIEHLEPLAMQQLAYLIEAAPAAQQRDKP